MTISRRTFLQQSVLATTGAFVVPSFLNTNQDSFSFKISLAEWSHHRELFSGQMNHLDFPIIAKSVYGLEAVEYVNQFFADKANDTEYLKELKLRANDHGVRSVLIMIDHEGAVSSTDDAERTKAVENHYKWIEAAKFLGCHAIRINLFGAKDANDWINASVDGLGRLAEFGGKHGISVLVENHGGHSSHAGRLTEIMRQVNSKWVGTLPDFGNFCIATESGEPWGSPCVEEYDLYQGVQEMMPFAKGVSAKTIRFDEHGNERDIDFKRMFTVIKNSGWNNGYVGIEYGGQELHSAEGILKTKTLLEKIREELG